eukprot:6200270-Pyramimonas_sp.AAC.1
MNDQRSSIARARSVWEPPIARMCDTRSRASSAEACMSWRRWTTPGSGPGTAYMLDASGWNAQQSRHKAWRQSGECSALRS